MTDPQWLLWANRIRSIAQAGLTYSEGPFDRERYEQLQELAAEIVAGHTQTPMPEVLDLFRQENGYPTPKVDVRGVVFKNDAILLVQEAQDNNLWTLPGGWADVFDSPREAVEREVREESGYETRAVRLLAVYDRDRQGHPPHPDAIYKMFFLCEITGGAPANSLETSGVGFFREENIPPLSLGRVLPGQIARCFTWHRHPELPTEFD